MTYESAKPRYTIELAGKSYDVEGTFELIDAIEWALKDNIINITMRALEMPVREMTKLLAVLIRSTGNSLSEKDVGDILFNSVGFGTSDYTTIAINVHAFLRIAIAKPSERQEVAKDMGELIGKLKIKEQ